MRSILALALAVALWLRQRRWLATVVAAVAIVFAVFDIAEVVHQVREAGPHQERAHPLIVALRGASLVGSTGPIQFRRSGTPSVSEPRTRRTASTTGNQWSCGELSQARSRCLNSSTESHRPPFGS